MMQVQIAALVLILCGIAVSAGVISQAHYPARKSRARQFCAKGGKSKHVMIPTEASEAINDRAASNAQRMVKAIH